MKSSFRLLLIAAAAFGTLAFSSPAQSQAQPAPSAAPKPTPARPRFMPQLTPEQIAALPKWTEVTMTTRDGVKLAANVFLPAGSGPFPAVLSRTPYLKDALGDFAGYSAQKYTDAGYAFVMQDVRGKGRSQGFYEAFIPDLEDGYDTVEWVAKQPWSNGKVGMVGASALGITTNLAAMGAPPHLVAAYVIVAPYDQLLNTFPGGVLKDEDTLGWLKGQGETQAQLDLVRGGATNTAFWNEHAMTTQRKFIRIPMYNQGAWYDIFNDGNVENFRWLQNNGSKGARGNQKLYMVPAGHGGLGGDKSDVEYNQPGALVPPAEEMRWWEYWLKGIDNGIMKEPPVTLFMMASGRKGHPSAASHVFSSPNWPPANHPTAYYLTGDMHLSTKAPSASDAKLSYQFDPANPVRTYGGSNLLQTAGPLDQRPIGQRQDYLRFETAALEKSIAIAGHVDMTLWAATDGLDTDFMVKLVDVYPDGYEQIILDNPIRARYRHGRDPDDVMLMTPGKPEELHIDLWNTAFTFEKAHKIQVTVTSSNSTKFEINPNTGEPFGVPTTTEPRVATNTVYFDKRHPSAMILPVLSSAP
ncbi:MAG TPA: CocE/NonD family hydrolase [Steroidobacteraceae bacterium]|nr:CocE/NonD family hydrolase [Steroidobacteraceae bacterium]